ncbi:MAG: hypothetical protein U0822_14420 [Anaerolineae bacterium]
MAQVKQNELLAYLFDRKPHRLTEPIAQWMTASPRFQTFVETYRDKIRKKIRVTQGQDSVLDLQAELATAYWLLRERRLTVEYEKCGAGQTRCPDFTTTYTTSFSFHVEVTRMRSSPPTGTNAAPTLEPVDTGRVTDIVCGKLGQMVSSGINMLVIVTELDHLDTLDLPRIMLQLKQRAEQHDPRILGRHGFRDPADFFRHYLRLSAVAVRDMQPERETVLWVNTEAKHPLPNPIRTILQK